MSITESDSLYDHLEQMNVRDLLVNINNEDQKIALAVRDALDQIVNLVEAAAPLVLAGGRILYMGAGTSGRLGILDASECPPTFGINQGVVIGLIAGGDEAIRNAVEHAEDDEEKGWEELVALGVCEKDFIIGISASGTTPYVVGSMQHCARHNIKTGCITSNPGSPLSLEAQFPVVVNTGPEFITGSTRMKSGSAQKMVLNMISTALMIRLGKVKGNKMVDMQLKNNKLVDRGARMISDFLSIGYNQAKDLLLKHGSVRKVLNAEKRRL